METITTQNRDLKDQLLRKGFELLNVVGNDITLPKLYYLHGNENKLTSKEKLGVRDTKKFQKGRSLYVKKEK